MEPPESSSPATVRGAFIASQSQPGVVYQLDTLARDSGMGATYFGRRQSDQGTTPVVVKVMKPELGQGLVSPELVAQKEWLALTRLNEAVPPTPFVARLLDFGTTTLLGRSMPWSAIEYVHGGVEGTSLEERVAYSLNTTGYGFAPERVRRLAKCLASGLTSVHMVDVIHRDLSPSNVLCCGSGETELFKLSNFGVARSRGNSLTFDGVAAGTIGYSAPESSDRSAGWHSDVFSLACIVYYALTGKHYFDAKNLVTFLKQLESTDRASVFDHVTLHPELQHDVDLGRAIDELLAQATALIGRDRPPTPREFERRLRPCLSGLDAAPHSVRALTSEPVEWTGSRTSHWSWTVRSWPLSGLCIRQAAWNADGQALALTNHGPRFWNGHTWVNAASLVKALPGTPLFVRGYGSGGWLLAGECASLTILDADGRHCSVVAPDPELSVDIASGDPDDLLVCAGRRQTGPIGLWTRIAKRWLRPYTLDAVSHLAVLERIDDETWVIGGAGAAGEPFAATFRPLHHALEPLPVTGLRPIVAGVSSEHRSIGVLVSGGQALFLEGGRSHWEAVSGSLLANCAALGPGGECWVGGAGALWWRAPEGTWSRSWSEPHWTMPLCALLADAGMVVGVARDGAIVEGRVRMQDA